MGGRELEMWNLAVQGGSWGGRKGESDEGERRRGSGGELRGRLVWEMCGRFGDDLKRFRAEQIRRKIVQGR